MEKDKKAPKLVYTMEEIKTIAPNYMGKPENFDPERAKSKLRPHYSLESANFYDQNAFVLPKPVTSDINRQFEKMYVRNLESFAASEFYGNYSKLIDIVEGMHRCYSSTRANKLRLEELAYFATAMLHMKILEVRTRGHCLMSDSERIVRQHVSSIIFNIPLPLFIYLNEIGIWNEKLSGMFNMNLPCLPVATIGRYGGYHAPEINDTNHNLFEEVPSLGVAGDMLMSLCFNGEQIDPHFRLGKPMNTEFTTNLLGRFNMDPLSEVSQDVIRRLNQHGIKADYFSETFHNTRLNIPYILHISHLLGKLKCFHIFAFSFENVSIQGGMTQVVQCFPKNIEKKENWRECIVSPKAFYTDTDEIYSHAVVFGFQLHKEDGPGARRSEKVANWTCLRGCGPTPWIMPDEWYANRNERRMITDKPLFEPLEDKSYNQQETTNSFLIENLYNCE